MPSLRKFLPVGLIFLSLAVPLCGQSLHKSAVPGLRRLLNTAGYVFSGTVTAVEYMPGATPSEVATMRITYHVDEAFQGVKSGQTLVIREWAGLWNAGERYRLGEHVLLFLYPPSRLGLTSPVGGVFGRMGLDSPAVPHSSSIPTVATSKRHSRDLLRAVRRVAEASHE